MKQPGQTTAILAPRACGEFHSGHGKAVAYGLFILCSLVMTESHNADTPRFVVLDGMRGLAALCVIMDHVVSPGLTRLFPGRYLAVDFFFVLSGFVLTHVYAERLRARMSLWAFMKVRIIRLYPLYILGSLAGGVLAFSLASRGLVDFPAQNAFWAFGFALLFLPCPTQFSTDIYNVFPLDGPGWSLFFELFVNLIFALLTPRMGLRLLIMVIAVSAVPFIFVTIHFAKLDLGWNWDNFWGGFPRVIYEFFAGVLIYRLRGRIGFALPPLLAFAALLLVFMIPTPVAWRWVYDLGAGLALCPVLVAVCAGSQVRGGLAQLSAAGGLLSYGIYILHVPIWKWLQAFGPDLYHGWDALSASTHYIVVVVAAIVVAALLDAAYDIPVRRWLSRRPKPGQA
jgi:peptidoglycan/LPS O-acetylase OafA/YrhL